ncbi:MAG: MerR family transcriptional regulator [Ignavibacteria bacterium]
MKEQGIKKLYYSISEVSKIAGLEQYILRYWESEFNELNPSKNRAGNRVYTNKDIQVILRIKKLLKDEKYTIEGAKKIIKEPEIKRLGVSDVIEPEKPPEVVMLNVTVNELYRRDLEEIKDFLKYLLLRL